EANTGPQPALLEPGHGGCSGPPAFAFSLPPGDGRSKVQCAPAALVSTSRSPVQPNCRFQSLCADPGVREGISATPLQSSTAIVAGHSTCSPSWPRSCGWHSVWVEYQLWETWGSEYFQRWSVQGRW